MGHIRLGPIPKTRPWHAVVSLIADIAPSGRVDAEGAPEGGASDRVVIASIAANTLRAAAQSLARAADDEALHYSFYLLSQITSAAAHDEWVTQLAQQGILLNDDMSVFGLAQALQSAIDDRIAHGGGTTDTGEFAQRAVGEVLVALAADNTATLFESSEADLKRAMKQLSTRTGFGRLSQHFFGRFVGHCLTFYLSRITVQHVGPEGTLTLGEAGRLTESILLHATESARILRDFASAWYSKQLRAGGVTPAASRAFLAVALSKLQTELLIQESAA